MIKLIEREEIPSYPGREPYSPIRLFAIESVKEFNESGAEAAEITEWPTDYKLVQVTAQIRDELWRTKLKGTVKVMQRGQRVFIAKNEDRRRYESKK